MDQRLRLHVVKVFHTFGALQTPADGVSGMVGNWRLELVQHFVQGAALGKLHDKKHVGWLGGSTIKFDDVGMVNPENR